MKRPNRHRLLFSRIWIGSPAFFAHFCSKESLGLGDNERPLAPDVRHDKRQTAGRPMRLVVSLLLIGQGFKTSGILLVAVGVAVIVFGLLPGVNFFTELPTLRGVVSLIKAVQVQRNNAVHTMNERISDDTVRISYLAFPYALQKIEQLREWFSSNPNVL